MRTKHLRMVVGIAGLVIGLSLLAKDPVPVLGNPPRTLLVKSGGEVVAQIVLTNRASVCLPPDLLAEIVLANRRSQYLSAGRNQEVLGAQSLKNPRGGLLTLEINSASGNSFKVVAEEFELVW